MPKQVPYERLPLTLQLEMWDHLRDGDRTPNGNTIVMRKSRPRTPPSPAAAQPREVVSTATAGTDSDGNVDITKKDEKGDGRNSVSSSSACPVSSRAGWIPSSESRSTLRRLRCA